MNSYETTHLESWKPTELLNLDSEAELAIGEALLSSAVDPELMVGEGRSGFFSEAASSPPAPLPDDILTSLADLSFDLRF